MQRIYSASTHPDIEHQPPPKRELLSGKYFVDTVQTSRGCPFNCRFCSVTAFNGGKYRLRNIDNVINEINGLKSKRIFIIDDNVIGSGQKYIKRAYQFFDRLKDSGKEWAGQTCLNIVEHDGLLKAAARSGAKVFLTGFESLDRETISSMNKSINLRATTANFRDAIRKIHDHGIAIVGCFIFGADTHSKDVFKRTVDFVLDTHIDAVQFTIETPLPGTELYRQLTAENRLLFNDYPDDWRRYTFLEPVFKPRNMTPLELHEGLVWSYKEVSSLRTSFVRGLRTLIKTKSLFSTGISFSWNYDAYKSISKTVTP
jgi:radical SAM superfamily enzyme YgiQ (UPF0313 family)